MSRESGDDLDALCYKMMSTYGGEFGDCNGKIIDNKTHQVVMSFNTCSLG